MEPDITEPQLLVLKWVAEGCPDDGRWPDRIAHKSRARSLENRKLITVNRSFRGWVAEITEVGLFYLKHGRYPDDHQRHSLDLTPVERPEEMTSHVPEPTPAASSRSATPGRKQARSKDPEPVWDIAAPRARVEARAKRSGKEPPPREHPWDDRVLVSVKEAAWVLSLSEGMIRRAAIDGDVQRVFIGEGTTHYRLVYESLLAWVNTRPRESPRYL